MFVRTWALASAAVLLMAGFASSGTDTRHASQVRVMMTYASCRATPMEVEPGAAAFTVVNRMRTPRTFTIDGRRTRYVLPGRTAVLRVSFNHDGVYRFFCLSRGPHARVRTGVVAVRPVAPPA